MSEADFVNVVITSETTTPTRQGFGTPLVLGYHTAWPDRVRTYRNLTDLAADGITSTGIGAGIYWAAAAIIGQTPRVKEFKVGRRTNIFTQTVDLIVTSATAGVVYKLGIGPLGTVASSLQRTVPGSSSVAAEAAAWKALIDGLSITGLTTALHTTSVTDDTVRCTYTAGKLMSFSAMNPEFHLMDSTSAPAAIDTDLDACVLADNDWYGFHLDSSSKAECLAAAAWVNTKLKVFFASTSDTENGTVGASSTLLKQLKALSYNRTSTWVDTAVCPSFLGAGIMGEEFPYDPGTQTGTYCAKKISGVTVDSLSTTFENEVVAQNGNVYTTVMGLNVTRPGVAASGEFVDTVIGRDWLVARLKEANFGVIAGNRRVPYNDHGVAMFRNATLGVLRRGQGTKNSPGFLDPEVDPVVDAPLVADVDPADRAARIFPDLTFSAKISGAIHFIQINGTISV